MDFAAIPMVVLDSPKFKALQYGDQKFIIDLYIVFGDCEQFIIDLNRPEDCRQAHGSNLARRINRVIAAGFLEVCSLAKASPCHYRRVYRLCYPAIAAYEQAA